MDDSNIKITPTAQGPAKLLNEEDMLRDESGITNPNLHTRIIKDNGISSKLEIKPRDYKLCVHNVNSYRTIEKYYHDEDSEYDEIP